MCFNYLIWSKALISYNFLHAYCDELGFPYLSQCNLQSILQRLMLRILKDSKLENASPGYSVEVSEVWKVKIFFNVYASLQILFISTSKFVLYVLIIMNCIPFLPSLIPWILI